MPPFLHVINKIIADADIILEVADARFPELSRNIEIEKKVKRAGKPIILVLNKADLVPAEAILAAKRRLAHEIPTAFFSSKSKEGLSRIFSLIFSLMGKTERACVKVAVCGYPNTGKSSVINAISGTGKARTGSKSGLTSGYQYVNARAKITLIDTPGIFPFGERDEAKAVLIGAKDFTKIKEPDLAAMEIIQMFLDSHQRALEEFYGITIEEEDGYAVLLTIGKARNLLKRGGEVDEHRAGVRVIQDWQLGKLRL